MIYSARSLGASRSGDTAALRAKRVERLSSIQKSLAESQGELLGHDKLRFSRRTAAAWLVHAEGKQEEALKLMQSASRFGRHDGEASGDARRDYSGRASFGRVAARTSRAAAGVVRNSSLASS